MVCENMFPVTHSSGELVSPCQEYTCLFLACTRRDLSSRNAILCVQAWRQLCSVTRHVREERFADGGS